MASAYAGEHMATEIRFDNEASDLRTFIEIETEDRLGLLYTISRTFAAELALDISSARIVTERAGPPLTAFTFGELDGRKVTGPDRLSAIETRSCATPSCSLIRKK